MKRFSILVIPGYKLFPIETGGAHHQLVYLAGQQQQHSIDLVVTPVNIAASHIADFKKEFPALKLIQVGYNKPSLINRWMIFIKKQYKKFLKKGFPYRFRKIKELRNLVLRDESLIRAIEEITRNGNYDIIQVEHTINLGVVELLPDEPLKIFVHHEIGHTRIESDLRSTGYQPQEIEQITAVAEKMELDWLNQYDGIITLCEEDKQLLLNKGIDRGILAATPFAFFEKELEPIYDHVKTPQLVFAGGESHYPNKEGLTWFLEEIYPLLTSKPGLLITGKWTDEFTKKYSGESIRFTGFVEDLRPVFRNSILVIPIRIGSGIRVKALTAFGYAAPVVATSFAVTGITGLQHAENILIANDPTAFAAAIEKLLNDPDLRNRIGRRGYDLAQKEFDSALFVKERNMFYETLWSAKNRD